MLFQILLGLTYSARTDEITAWTFNEQRVSKNAEIIIRSIDGYGDFYLMIQNTKQYKIFRAFNTFICNATQPAFDYISTYYIDTSNLPQNFPINPNMSGGIYHFTIYNCLSPIRITRITFSFLNTWGRLPFEKYPLLFICWIETGFYLVLFILCLINSLKHRELRVLLHYLILGTVFICTASTATSSLLFLYANDKNDRAKNINQSAISISASVLLCLRNFCLLMLSLFLVSGLSIVYERLKTKKVIMIISLSAIFTIVEFMIDSYISYSFSLGVYSLFFIFFIVLYILFTIFLVNLSSHSLNTLNAHIVMIYSANIDPETTPSYRKKELLETCKRCSIAILLIFVASSILYSVGVFYYFISYLLIAISMAVLVSIICWTCRLRYKMAATYCDDEDAYVINDGNNGNNDQQQNFVQSQFQYQLQEQNPSTNQNANATEVVNANPYSSPYSNPVQSQNQGLQQKSSQIASSLMNADDEKDDDDMSLSSSNGFSEDNNNNTNTNKSNNTNTNKSNNTNTRNNENATANNEINADIGNGNIARNDDTGNNINDAENNNNNNNNGGGNQGNLIPWEYGMKLPPMPQEDFAQNQVHPTD